MRRNLRLLIIINHSFMPVIRITKEFHFEMAHALWNYNGLCKNIHGHSYKLYVTIIGVPLNDTNDPNNGMLVDFSVLKALVKTNVLSYYDHSLILFKNSPPELLKNVSQMFEKFHIVDFQPTCENLVLDITNKILEKLPGDLKLHSIRLNETATAYAEWYADDNLFKPNL
jgi:6-pyruvoyltetrahydropterin/6-carboxytetrahydropterin synthase